MRILITTPQLHRLGGVANHYKGLKPYWSSDVQYFCIGAPKWRNLLFLYYYTRFAIKLIIYRPDVVMINPSMAKVAIWRDFTYLRIAKALGRKVAVFFHGFHVEAVAKEKKMIVTQLNRCSLIFVLSNEFKHVLTGWGVTTPISLTTTKVDDRMLDISNKAPHTGTIRNILYLARVTRAKGIFVALDVFSMLSHKYPDLQFTVVGDGQDLKSARRYAKQLNINNILFTGGLSGVDVAKKYQEADCYLFTSYHEGMPTSVLEAMAFGLPVITRPLGGLNDFFKSGEMGYFVDSADAKDYMEAFETLINNPEKVKQISEQNREYASKHFMASAIAPTIEQQLKKL